MLTGATNESLKPANRGRANPYKGGVAIEPDNSGSGKVLNVQEAGISDARPRARVKPRRA